MKITDIETYPVWDGSRNFLFVVLDTDEGIYSVGEAGITGRELVVGWEFRQLIEEEWIDYARVDW